MEQKLDEIIQRLKDAAGANLKSVVLYGSAVTGEFAEKHSDLNILCIVEQASAAELEELHPVAKWWTRQGHPAPLVFTLNELQHVADIFAIELLDIRVSHRTLYGPDVFETFEVPIWLHRYQVECELRRLWLRLRHAVLAAPRSNRVLRAIMLDSISSFATLFRHALMGMGEPPAHSSREAISRAAAIVGADPAPLLSILDVREGKKKPRHLDVEETLHGYLELVELFADEVDRRFEPHH